MVRLTDRPDMTLDVYRGRKITIQHQQHSEIYLTAKETRKFFTLKLIKNKIGKTQETFVTCKTNCIVYSKFYM